MTVNKKTTQRQGFKTTNSSSIRRMASGQILAIEEQEVAGLKLELFVIKFIKDKMTLRVPTTQDRVGRYAQACRRSDGQARA
jgi:CarD family transcriptional regulator